MRNALAIATWLILVPSYLPLTLAKPPRLSKAGRRELDELLTKTAEDGRLPGFVLAVSNVDEQIYAKGRGNLVYGDRHSPTVDPNKTLFWICSMTKLPTSIAALQLIEEGKLSFDTPVSDFFPEFNDAVVLDDPFTDPNPSFKPVEKNITVLQLLSHQSGLYYSLPTSGNPYHNQTAPYIFRYSENNRYEEFFKELKGKYPGIPLTHQPGDSFFYGFSIDVVGFIVEKVTGLSLGEYSRQKIFGPLGIENTFHLTAAQKERLLPLHFRNENGSISGWEDRLPLPPRYPEPVHLDLGGVGSYATLPDYLTLLRHILQIEAGVRVHNPILRESTVKSLFEPRLTPVGEEILTWTLRILEPNSGTENLHSSFSTALAVNKEDWAGRRKAGSGFWSGWAGTLFHIDPKTGIAMVFGTQIVTSVTMDSVATEIAEKAERIVYANLVY